MNPTENSKNDTVATGVRYVEVPVDFSKLAAKNSALPELPESLARSLPIIILFISSFFLTLNIATFFQNLENKNNRNDVLGAEDVSKLSSSDLYDLQRSSTSSAEYLKLARYKLKLLEERSAELNNYRNLISEGKANNNNDVSGDVLNGSGLYDNLKENLDKVEADVKHKQTLTQNVIAKLEKGDNDVDRHIKLFLLSSTY